MRPGGQFGLRLASMEAPRESSPIAGDFTFVHEYIRYTHTYICVHMHVCTYTHIHVHACNMCRYVRMCPRRDFVGSGRSTVVRKTTIKQTWAPHKSRFPLRKRGVQTPFSSRVHSRVGSYDMAATPFGH